MIRITVHINDVYSERVISVDSSHHRRIDPAEQADALSTTLLMECQPVGVKVFSDSESFESWPMRTPDMPVYYCSAVKMASSGVALKMSVADFSCETALKTLGLEPGMMDPEFLESYVSGGLYRDVGTARSVLSGVLTLSDTVGFALAPLGAFTAETPPDVVIVPTNPYGVMRLTQATSFLGERVRNESIGMHGICSESTAAPHTTGCVTASTLCSGTRHVAGWDDRLMSVGIPVALLQRVIDGLLETADRYETDERKGQMRAACSCRAPRSSRAAQGVASLRDGAGYFCGE